MLSSALEIAANIVARLERLERWWEQSADGMSSNMVIRGSAEVKLAKLRPN